MWIFKFIGWVLLLPLRLLVVILKVLTFSTDKRTEAEKYYARKNAAHKWGDR